MYLCDSVCVCVAIHAIFGIPFSTLDPVDCRTGGPEWDPRSLKKTQKLEQKTSRDFIGLQHALHQHAPTIFIW